MRVPGFEIFSPVEHFLHVVMKNEQYIDFHKCHKKLIRTEKWREWYNQSSGAPVCLSAKRPFQKQLPRMEENPAPKEK